MSNGCPVCGYVPAKVGGKPRSIDQHRRFFGLMRALLHHWPETHPRQFADEHELRTWLTMKAGHREVAAHIPLTGVPREKVAVIVEAALRAAGTYALPILHGDALVIFKPKSIKFSKLSHLDFCGLSDAVDVVIRQETGLEPDVVLKETEAAA
jgi:hypothetical protein